MVEETRTGRAKLSELKNSELPLEMQKLSVEEQKAYVGKKQKERDTIQARITDLASQRAAFIKKEMDKRGDGKNSFDQLVLKAVKAQALKQGVRFE